MINEKLQGDIFETGYTGNYTESLVFGHRELNNMTFEYDIFVEQLSTNQRCLCHFTELPKPTMTEHGTTFKFVNSTGIHNGINDSDFEKEHVNFLDWALAQGVTKVIPNISRDPAYSKNSKENLEIIRKRVLFIEEMCSREKYR